MRHLFLFIACLWFSSVFAQSPLTSNSFNYHLIDRYEILSGEISVDLFTGIKPLRRDAVSTFASKIKPISSVDSFNKTYLLNDNVIFSQATSANTTKPILKRFYKVQNALFYVNEPRFKLIVNPVLGFSGGNDLEDSISTFRNSRGFELRGTIGNKVGFYSYALENQYRFPSYIREKHQTTDVVNGATLAKPFGSQGRDFFNVAGYITFSPIEEIMVQFGHDKNFLGNGYRSLILSDLAAPHPFLKINTKVWKINYTNLFSQHIDYRGYAEKKASLRKYSALHQLSVNVGKNLTLGLFENVIFDRQDSTESGSYEISYLNPLIFYRAVEHGLNSSDNVMLGFDWKWNFLNRFSFYGQFVLDEFIKNEFFDPSSTSWVNKNGLQAGLKYMNVANVNNLDLQLEFNQVRPHTYQHEFKSQNWIHYDQSLAHPLGANFRETVAIVRYQPINRLTTSLVYSYSKQGIDSSNTSINFGGDITRDIEGLQNKANVTLFQGIENIVGTFTFDASYMLYHNLFIDAGILFRTQSNPLLVQNNNTTLLHLGLRLNTAAFDYRQ
ncbi:MAG: hypothetical protein HKP14_08365 [Bacteroidia bacterium]|nr:hypothetical protein [Bacteroidia bacterium]